VHVSGARSAYAYTSDTGFTDFSHGVDAVKWSAGLVMAFEVELPCLPPPLSGGAYAVFHDRLRSGVFTKNKPSIPRLGRGRS
jgi:hypothetical protein